MYWRAWVTDSPERSAANGNPIILTPWSHFYLSSPSTDENLQKLYSYDPVDLFSSDVMKNVEVRQGCFCNEELPPRLYSKSMFSQVYRHLPKYAGHPPVTGILSNSG